MRVAKSKKQDCREGREEESPLGGKGGRNVLKSENGRTQGSPGLFLTGAGKRVLGRRKIMARREGG